MKIAPLCLLALAALTVQAASLPLSKLDLTRVSQAGRPPRAGLTAGNHPIRISGRLFADGFGTQGASRLEISLDGRAQSLAAWVGIADDTVAGQTGPACFQVIGDGRILYASEHLMKGDAARRIDVPLTGIKDLVLAVQVPDQPRTSTAWAEAAIDYDGAAPVSVDRVPEKPYVLTPKPGPQPRITGADVVGAGLGHPFLFKVPATGARPIEFLAEGLPAGLVLDSASGIVSGSVAAAGEYRVLVTARNAAGSSSRRLHIVVGDTLALTPPMGWNSWNCFAAAVTAGDVRAAADAFVSTGLIDHGWTYVNVDDYWMTRPQAGDPVVRDLTEQARSQGKQFRLRPMNDPSLVGPARDSEGRINANPRFPDMAGLAAHIHSLGLKAGLYSSPGPLTCGECIASYGHEAQDAARFAGWGFDYLKYDWCSYSYYALDEGRAERIKPYRLMGRALRAQKRDIVYSLCQYGMSDVWEWGANIGGNSWRTTDDITDSWGSMSGIGFSQNGHEAYAGPGHWNDPDMLVVGWVGWARSLHPTRLSPDEQYTHISLWSLLASPLLIGCDLQRLDDFTLGLLTNDEVIAVDQDSLGRAARRVAREGDTEVWSRPLADGSIAVGLFNRGELPAMVTARWGAIGVEGPRTVRDLWRQRDLGHFTGRYEALVPRHGVVLVKVMQ